SPLASDIDTSALVGYAAAQKYLGYVTIARGEKKAGPPSTIYVRAATGHEAAVQALLAPTANPEAPNEVNVSQPSDVLTARAAAAIYAGTKGWAIVIPVEAWLGGIASAILIGAFAGLMPAVRASRLPPTVALRTV